MIYDAIFNNVLQYILMSLFLIICILFANNLYLQIIIGILFTYNLLIINNEIFSFLLLITIFNIIFNIIYTLIYKKLI